VISQVAELIWNAIKIWTESRDSSVYSAGLRDGWSGVRFPIRVRNFYPRHSCVQTGSGAHPHSYTMGTRGSLGAKRPGREADHLPPSSAEVKNVCAAIPPLPQYASMALCSKKSWGHLYLHFKDLDCYIQQIINCNNRISLKDTGNCLFKSEGVGRVVHRM
jgi:hypothetical protein